MILWRAKTKDSLARWDALMRVVETPFAKEVEEEKNRYIQEAAANFPLLRQLSQTGADLHTANMLDIAARYDGIAIRIGLKEALGGIKSVHDRLNRKEDWDKLWLYLVRLWIHENGAKRARETAATTRQDMQRVIDLALAPDVEFNPVEVATSLLRVQAMSAWRASTIARTEVHAAMMFASEEGAAKLGRDDALTLLKSWLPVTDERTRVSHAAMASHPAIGINEDFLVGGVRMKRPGDPRGGADNCVNCRCVLTFKEQE